MSISKRPSWQLTMRWICLRILFILVYESNIAVGCAILQNHDLMVLNLTMVGSRFLARTGASHLRGALASNERTLADTCAFTIPTCPELPGRKWKMYDRLAKVLESALEP